MLPETGKAAKQIDGALEAITALKSKHDDEIAGLAWRLVYAAVEINQIAQRLTPAEAEPLMDLCRVLYAPKVVRQSVADVTFLEIPA